MDENYHGELFEACEKGDLLKVKKIFETEDVEVRNNGRTLLTTSVAKGHLDILKFLIEYVNILIESEVYLGWTALLVSCRYDRLEVIKYLIE